jgi:uncharacterized protein YndB with AHSA1/START domain
MDLELKFQVQTKIQKPLAEVFDAVYNQDKLAGYFISKASGPLVEGAEVFWTFPDYPGDHPIYVKKVIPNELIAFEWQANDGNYNTKVEIKFEKLNPESTMVSISETGWKNTQKGLDSSYMNCHGWTQMSASLKAYLEYGINLRKGYY